MLFVFRLDRLLVSLVFFTTSIALAQNNIPGSGDNTQIETHQQMLKKIQTQISQVSSKFLAVKNSISNSSDVPAQIDCSTNNVPQRFIGRCGELVMLNNALIQLRANELAVQNIIQSFPGELNKNITLESSKINPSTVVAKNNSIDQFAADKETPDCTLNVLKGWKCLNTTVTTYEGKTYKILLKWNRPNIASNGTVFMAVGGSGMGESRTDAPSKAMMDYLSDIDKVRLVALEMTDVNPANGLGGGYWIHSGGYISTAQVFIASLELAMRKNLMKGSFLNYLGGSNGSAIAAAAMSKYNADIYFDRVVFQMGPFLSDFKTGCDKNSPSSLFLNSGEQFNKINEYLGLWRYGDTAKKICDDMSEDRISILKGSKNNFPNTRVHVIIGAKELKDGYGPWMLASNLEWYNSIQAKSKSRLIRPNMAHQNSYEDMRRFLKLGPDEVVDNTLEVCKTGSFVSNGQNINYSCGCGTVEGAVFQADGCFHKVVGYATTPPSVGPGPTFGPGPTVGPGPSFVAPAPTFGPNFAAGPAGAAANTAPANTCNKGTFKNGDGKTVEFSCGCGDVSGGVKQADGCFHKISSSGDVSPSIPAQSNTPAATQGFFCNNGLETQWTCNVSSKAGWVDVGNGCFHLSTQKVCR